MPAGFTHMTLSRVALDRLSVDSPIKMLAQAELGAYLVGCVGPDLPYMAPFDGFDTEFDLNEIADDLHHRKTIAIPIAGMDLAKKFAAEGNIRKAEAFWAFFLGYFSHVVADGFTHPFVRDRVGNYSDETKDAHRTLEMKIDVLVLNKFMGYGVNGVSPQNDLTLFEDCENKTEVMEAYATLLKDNHGWDLSAEALDKLYNGLVRAFNISEGKFIKWYSIPVGEAGYAYMDLEDVKKQESQVRKLERATDADAQGIKYNSYGDKEIDIFDDVFELYFKHMPKVIEATHKYVFDGGGDYLHLIPEINLDNGRQVAVADDLKQMPKLLELA